MFGIWRTLLAIEVVAFHLLFVHFVGAYAVFSFFVLSGFLMTAIVQKTYGYTAGGFARYLGNRALRLYPSYGFALLVSIALIAALGTNVVQNYHPAMTLPATASEWLENLTMIFPAIVPRDVMPRLVPLAWALTVEIVYYILIGIGISRTRGLTWWWFGVSLAYLAVAQTLQHPRDVAGELIPIYQYSAIPAGSLPFSVGALVWHYRTALHRQLSRFNVDNPVKLIVGRWVVYVAIAAVQSQTGWTPLVMTGNWLNIALSSLIVCTLFHCDPPDRMRKVDKAIGDFSYPIYLLHMQMGLLAAMLLFGAPVEGRSLRSLAMFAVGLLMTITVGAVCARLIDPVAERLRTRIKHHTATPVTGK
jgi:peptidoglycan/LPS O-acetylase OafA/YrhL